MNAKRMALLVSTLPIILSVSVLGCSLLGGEGEAATSGEQEAPPGAAPQGPPPESPCGDGVCDEAEQANPNLCPQDCAAGDAAQVFELRVTGHMQRVPKQLQCNSDSLSFQFDALVSVDANGTLGGSGEGEGEWSPICRTPGTEYDGVRMINDPAPALTVSGSLEGGSYQVALDVSEVNEFFFTSGEVYSQGPLLNFWMGNTPGTDVEGTLAAFVVPQEQFKTGAVFSFEDPGSDTPDGLALETGDAQVEICEPDPSGTPFGGCRTTP